MRLTVTMISLLSLFGCRSRQEAPTRAGVSASLTYPVLLIGQGGLDVRDSEAALTTFRGASSLNLNERQILDADGRLFPVTSAEPIAGQGWMGSSTARNASTVASFGSANIAIAGGSIEPCFASSDSR